MSIYKISFFQGQKVAREITSKEEYLNIRNSEQQLCLLNAARSGDESKKRMLVQFNYSGHYPNAVIKGNKLASRAFGFDIDDLEAFDRAKKLLLADPEKYGLLMLERSVRQGGHAIFVREKGKTILENQVRIAQMLGCEMDTSAHDINRVYFTTSASSEDLLFLSSKLFRDQYRCDDPEWIADLEQEARTLEDRERYGQEELPEGAHKKDKHYMPAPAPKARKAAKVAKAEVATAAPVAPATPVVAVAPVADVAPESPIAPIAPISPIAPIAPIAPAQPAEAPESPIASEAQQPSAQASSAYQGIPYPKIIDKWWEMYNGGKTPVTSNRDTLTFELAVNLRHICGFDRQVLDEVIPCYDGFPYDQKMKCIDSALSERRTQMPRRMRDVLEAVRFENSRNEELSSAIDSVYEQDDNYFYSQLPRMPQGISDSIEAVGSTMAMPVITAICPAIGMLASDVELEVHNQFNHLNLISYIAGDFASGKGSIDPVIKAWLEEVVEMDRFYLRKEEDYRNRKRAAKNKKEQPEEPKFPIRFLTLNNTVANLAERLANTQGRHAFSFTPEADTVAQKWKSSMSDFSVMLRQSYDGSSYEREARSIEAVNVHIDHLLWNVTMCGTPDALNRVVNNYTDGFQSRLAIARTPDNTFAPLNKKLPRLSDTHAEHIRQVAHLLMAMKGQLVLPKLENQSQMWLEKIRRMAIENDDRVFARQRMRVAVTAMRMTCCIMLCQVADRLIKEHGMAGAEQLLKETPEMLQELTLKAQTQAMLETYDLIADSLIETSMYYFHDAIEQAFSASTYKGNGRTRKSKNDSIYQRLALEFNIEEAYQQTLLVKGSYASRSSVYQMMKNWSRQGLVEQIAQGRYRKI